MVPVFSQVLGDAGRIALALGGWSVVFTSVTGSATAYALLLSDFYYRFLPYSGGIREQDEGRGAAYLPAFRPLLLIFATLPLMVLFTDWKPVPLLMATAIVAAVLLPATIVVLLRLANDRSFVGNTPTAGWATKAFSKPSSNGEVRRSPHRSENRSDVETHELRSPRPERLLQ